MVMAKFRVTVAVSKQKTHTFLMERFRLKKLKEIEGKQQYRVEILNRFAALESLDDYVDTNKAWEIIRDNVKISAKRSTGYYKSKKRKTWLDERC
jgi:hypothetical protein